MTSVPKQADLEAALAQATGFRVLDGGVSDPRPEAARVAVASGKLADVVALRTALTIRDGEHFCMCGTGGDATLCIDGPEATIKLGIHHGQALQWDERWRMHAALRAPQAVADLFASLGWLRYRDELKDAAGRADRADAEHARWLEAMPTALRSMESDLYDHAGGGVRTAQLAIARTILVDSAGSDVGAAAALLRWYGNGRGEWSGFPSYETLATQLLLTFPASVVVRAIEGLRDDAALAGAARHCASWDFRKERKRLPGTIVAKLREWLETHGDADQRSAYAAAFRKHGSHERA